MTIINIATYITESFAKSWKILPIKEDDQNLWIWHESENNLYLKDILQRLSGKNVSITKMDKASLERCIQKFYHPEIALHSIGKEQKQTFLDEENSDPIVNYFNELLILAVDERASDIHIEPFENYIQVRFRIDGLLISRPSMDEKKLVQLVARIKILSKLDVAMHKVAQDGRFKIVVKDKKIDCRVSLMPTIHGERVVIRLLNQDRLLYSLSELGLDKKSLENLKGNLLGQGGVILVTGPTGSGKTTSLYSIITYLKSDPLNIITLEDPVEYKLEGVNQIAVNPKIGLTFSKGLKNILRQDPDIILVGEIRDKETAQIAISAGLTGHLVLASLHTNNAPHSLTRLIDMGIEPFLISSSVKAIVAQRLIRIFCTYCKNSKESCSYCRDTGFFDREAIFEYLSLSDTLRQYVNNSSSAGIIRKYAIKEGMKTLLDNGMDKVNQGRTSREEIYRVCGIPERREDYVSYI